jgi:PPM family protein phosphatase
MAAFAIELRSGGRNEDRAACYTNADATVFVLSDGAGGVGSGALAAEIVLQEALALLQGQHKTAFEALHAAELRIQALGGMATGVIVVLRHGQLTGASCGDSRAWLVSEERTLELTSGQFRKPLLGSGGTPVMFGPEAFVGRLLLASDGLVNYATESKISGNALLPNIHEAAEYLAEMPRLPTGAFPDDVAILLAEAVF